MRVNTPYIECESEISHSQTKEIEMYSGIAEVPPRRRHTGQRKIILVDLENVVGGAVLTPRLARCGRARIEAAITIDKGDQIVLATSHNGCMSTAAAWPDKRYLVRSGPNGADLALLDELACLKADRYDRVVLVSGDGIFTKTVAELVGSGVAVTVVARRGHCSRRLQMAASRLCYLSDDAGIGEVA